ncbi:hypothetical protein YC2023_027616 [Brassica napus]
MSKNTAILTGESSPPLLFRQVSPGPGDSTLQFRFLHFWEARKNVKGVLGIILGIEMLMIDAEGTLALGFIGQNRRSQYEKELQRGRIYTLTNFYASNSKVMYHVADQRLVICISHDSALSKDEEDVESILTERFRVHSFSDFEANCDLRGDLHGKLCLSSMSSSRVFLDEDVDPTSEYLAWLSANPSATSLVNPVEVVKAETLTISEIAVFLKREPAKVAYFDCIATIDDVKLGAEWYYIACKDCQTKLNRGPTTLLCPKCHNEDATALAKIKVSPYNFTSTRLSLTATKIISPAVLPPKNTPLSTPLSLLGAQNHRPGAEVGILEVAESSGSGTSATDDQKEAKRIKRSG